MAKESGAELGAEKTLDGIWNKKFGGKGGAMRKAPKRKRGKRKNMARKMATLRALSKRG